MLKTCELFADKNNIKFSTNEDPNKSKRKIIMSWPGDSTAVVARTWCRRCLHHMSLQSEQHCSAGFTVLVAAQLAARDARSNMGSHVTGNVKS